MSRNIPILKEDSGHRQATWLELFFDLVFVVSIASLSKNLEHHIALNTIFEFSILLLAIWWLWMEFSYYADLFDSEDLSHELFMVLDMVGTIVIAVVVRENDAFMYDEFTIVYTVLTLLLMVMHLIAYFVIDTWRNVPKTFSIGLFISAILWFISLFVDSPYKFVLWILGIVVQMSATPVIYLIQKKYPKQNSHMPERFGLFMIIILGEGLASIITGLDDLEWSLSSICTGLTGFALILAMYKLYFYRVKMNEVTETFRDESSSTYRTFIYGYSHYFIYGSAIFISIGLLLILRADTHYYKLFLSHFIHMTSAVFLIAITISQYFSLNSLSKALVYVRLFAAMLSIVFIAVPFKSEAVGLVLQTILFLIILAGEFYLNFRENVTLKRR